MDGLDRGAEPGVGGEGAEGIDHEGELGVQDLGEGGVEGDKNVFFALRSKGERVSAGSSRRGEDKTENKQRTTQVQLNTNPLVNGLRISVSMASSKPSTPSR